MVNWALARAGGWQVAMRVEDLGGPRIKPDSAAGILATLEWLGLDWDGPVVFQSANLSLYREALGRLAEAGRAYPCDLTRQEIEAATEAPQAGSGEVRFPRELRPQGFEAGKAQPGVAVDVERSWRFAVEPGVVEFDDAFAGPQRIDPSATIGDFAVWTRFGGLGTPAYQLAVVVDDARAGVTDVIRGDDLLDSAARQTLVYGALGLGPPPRYGHLPLVVGGDGRRLAKRHGDTRVDSYRSLGVPAEAIVGLVAFWSGATEQRERMTAADLVERLGPSRIPRRPVVFGPEDDRWLREQAG